MKRRNRLEFLGKEKKKKKPKKETSRKTIIKDEKKQ